MAQDLGNLNFFALLKFKDKELLLDFNILEHGYDELRSLDQTQLHHKFYPVRDVPLTLSYTFVSYIKFHALLNTLDEV